MFPPAPLGPGHLATVASHDPSPVRCNTPCNIRMRISSAAPCPSSAACSLRAVEGNRQFAQSLARRSPPETTARRWRSSFFDTARFQPCRSLSDVIRQENARPPATSSCSPRANRRNSQPPDAPRGNLEKHSARREGMARLSEREFGRCQVWPAARASQPALRASGSGASFSAIAAPLVIPGSVRRP